MTRRVRITPRGLGLAAVGTLVTVAGVLLGVRIPVQVGLLLLAVVAFGFVTLTLQVRTADRGGLAVLRRVTPHPVTVGDSAVVDVELTSTGTVRRLDRLDIAEQAARELSGPSGLRARVHRTQDALRLNYPISPAHRGRWTIGPLQVQRLDLFGTVRWTGPLGPTMQVAVRPRITPLDMDTRSASTDIDRSAKGTRMPAADDASLRDYRPGDDLRRVHWATSARRAELMVRQDERAARRLVSVVLDLPEEDAAAEWSISAAASVALALLRSGHRVRLLCGATLSSVTSHHHPDVDGSAADALLDETVDLTLPPNRFARDDWLDAAIDTLGHQGGGAELVFAVVGALEPGALASLARLGDANLGWAMVRLGRAIHSDAGDDTHTLDALRRAGWRVCGVEPGEDIAVAWSRLHGSDRSVEALR
jgi:uncharacterized protein (DUF58 family)